MSASAAGLCPHGIVWTICQQCYAPKKAIMAIPSLVESTIKGTKFRFSSEKDLQDGLEKLFLMKPFIYSREVDLGVESRIDFLLDEDTSMPLGIEVKVDGSLSAVTRQLHRYAQSPKIGQLMLVTSKMQHDHMPREMNGKQIYVVHLGGSVF